MSEAQYHQDSDSIQWIAAAALAAGQVVQLEDGRAGVIQGLKAIAAGDAVSARVRGIVTMAKTTSMVLLKGQQVFWDAATNKVKYTGDWPVGVVIEDCAAAATTCLVDLNVTPQYVIEQGKDTWSTVSSTGTVAQVVGGNQIALSLTTAGSAQHAWLVSDKAVDVDDGPILEGWLILNTAADNAVVDIDLGLASGAGTADFEALDAFAAFHNDGADLNLDVQSDDGTTDIAPVDSGVDLVAGTPVFCQLDLRDKTAPAFYVGGVKVTSTGTTLAAYSGTLKVAVAIEKSGTDDSPGVIEVTDLRVRTGLRT
jgi:predicted RecA/RadA family phage recombinase